MVGPATRLRKFKLRESPRRIAIQYIDWTHQFRFAPEEKSPLQRLLDTMEAEIRKRAKSDRQAEELFREAEREVFLLINMYGFAVCGLINAIRSSLELTTFVLAFTQRGREPSQDLFAKLIVQSNQLLVCLIAVSKIETELLRGPVLPEYLREHSEHQRDVIATDLERVRTGAENEPTLLTPEECGVLAERKLAFLESGLGEPYDSLPVTFRVVEAEVRLIEGLEDYKQRNDSLFEKFRQDMKWELEWSGEAEAESESEEADIPADGALECPSRESDDPASE